MATEPARESTLDPAMTFAVVINDEEQYSIWTAGGQPPAGWRATGFTGTKQDCLADIAKTWTDMRPRSLREGVQG
jgi:MbtH protein